MQSDLKFFVSRRYNDRAEPRRVASGYYRHAGTRGPA